MIEVPADSVLGEDHLPGLWAAAFSLSAHVAFSGQRERAVCLPLPTGELVP